MAKSKTERCAIDLVPLSDPGEAQASEVMLSPWGKVIARDGRIFLFDEESAKDVVADFESRKNDMPIDFEHASVPGSHPTLKGAAPAAGWVSKIYAKSGIGIFGLVKWTETARAMIKADEYRYLSPHFFMDRDSKRALSFISAGLTNTPAMDGMLKVAAKETIDGEKTMDLKHLIATLKLAGVEIADDADESAVLAAGTAYIEKAVQSKAEPQPLTAVAAKLGLAKDATSELIVAKVAELQTNVPAAEYKVVTARLEALELAAKDLAAQELVASAIESAKLNPNDEKQMGWARNFAKVDQVAFKAWSEASPALYSAGRLTKASAKLDGGDERTTVIQAAKAEYGENRGKLQGVEAWAFVNAELSTKGMSGLSADERKALKV